MHHHLVEHVVMAVTNSTITDTRPDYVRGALFALVGPLVGATSWLLIWQANFIASIAAYVMAILTIRFYRKGSGVNAIDKPAMYIILGYIAFGILLSLFASFTSDSVRYLLNNYKSAREAGVISLLTSSDFWSYNFANLKDPTILKQYQGTLVMALVFSSLGVYRIVRRLLMAPTISTQQQEVTA
jgi:hypothetical protein